MKFVPFRESPLSAEIALHAFARARLTLLHSLGQDSVVRASVVYVEAYSFFGQNKCPTRRQPVRALGGKIVLQLAVEIIGRLVKKKL